jgi:hypothetical protein
MVNCSCIPDPYPIHPRLMRLGLSPITSVPQCCSLKAVHARRVSALPSGGGASFGGNTPRLGVAPLRKARLRRGADASRARALTPRRREGLKRGSGGGR